MIQCSIFNLHTVFNSVKIIIARYLCDMGGIEMSNTVKVLIGLAILIVLSFAVWDLRNDIADGEGFTKKNIIKFAVFIGIFVLGVVAIIVFVPNIL